MDQKSHIVLVVYLAFIATTCIPDANEYTLIIPLYGESKAVRQEEYLTCLHKNIENNLIEKIHILYDTSSSHHIDPFLETLEGLAQEHHPKITISFTDKRQTYGDAFMIAKNLYTNKMIILSNADIYFDNSLKLLLHLKTDNTVYALTRWELSSDGPARLMRDATGFPAVYSQDVWIFRSPLSFFPGHNITMGVIACDHKLNYELLKAGYNVFNPCFDIRCYHVHHCKIHNCKLESVPFAYSAYIPWCRIQDVARKQSDIWATE